MAGEGGQGGEGPGIAVDPDWPAYVIYTSGSTGRPKGVVVTHGNVLRLMASTEDWFGFSRQDVWTLFHSFAFDFSVWELWGPLLYGGRLVVVPYLVSRSPEAMLELLDREGVTVLNQTPSAFRALQQVESEGGKSVRWVVFGGEALEPRSLESWWRKHDTGLINMYGITETTVHVTYRRLGEAEILGGGGSVIGVPLRDLSIHVLDALGNPVPIGVAGEMYVGGAGVALGYLNRPELTAERFVPDHFGARLYRSGDLGRWRASGELEYLGRIDHQVKVRGFRIELGEIESVLLQKPGVDAAVVLVREDTPGDRRLVAYVVGESDGLRAWVKERLPEYMVPAAFVALEALPLTPNGKVDRKTLPAPGLDRSESEYVAPRTEEEEVLAAVWAQVLGLDRVGVEDNFFALGGDSILSLRVVALAGERGLALSLPDLFQHQTIAELTSSIRKTSSEAVRREPFSLISEEDRGKLPEDVEDAYPLAALQAGMLYHMELTPEDPLYHNVDSWQVKGRFDKELFEEAVRRVVARHPILRTSFAMTGYSEPLQLAHRHAVLPLTVEDVRHLAEQEAVIDRLVAREKIDQFDLTKAPQLRFHVFLRSEETYQFTLAENHAIFDGWSLHSTLAEIFELYYALLSGKAPEPLPPLELTYREFIRLEREALTSPETQAYWHRLLEEAEPVEVPRWPEEYRRPSARRVATVDVSISPELTAGLKRVAREAAVPLKSVLLAAHCKVLSLLAGRPDVISGVVSNGRLEENEGDQVRGLFLNTLPLRLRVSEDWRELIRAAFRAEQEMLPHRRYPFGALQRQWGERPLYEIAFNFIRFHVVRDLMRSGHFEILGFKKAEGGNFKLQAHFSFDLEQQGIGLELEYDSHEVAAVQVREIAEVYLRTLEAISEDRYEPVLPPASRHRLLWEWNDTAVEYGGADRCLHELVEAQAQRTPDRLAVEIEGQSLTYRELSRRTNQLARHLQRLGVEPEMPVGICAERSLELVVGLLGILKAGGAYVPLDPEYPQERLDYMVEDSGARVVLTSQDLRGDWEGDGPEVRVSPDNLAYVIYTSGSTGKPKGVMNTHRGIANRLLWMQASYGLDGTDVVLQKTPASFDVSVWEFFWPLMTGATLALARPGGHRDGSYLVERIEEAGVTTLHFVPSMLRAFLETPGLERCRSLRRVMASGEALTPDLEERFFSRFTCKLHNLYGPTEAAVDVTFWPCTGDSEHGVPIGWPIANTRIHLLDGALEPVPVGVAGELYIGGVNLARGYAGRPELTAERFIASPTGFGERLYRTGDLARYRPDGAIEYLGRVDHQVKIRGLRIELGEIEAALGQHPGVAQAAVLVMDGKLIAYLVGEMVPTSGLRAFLLRSLPEYMVPAVFVPLPAFPLTPSGKVDRRALSASAASAAPTVESGDGYVAPSDLTEELLAAIWSEVLGLARIGVRDDFFALGGHSLLATQVVSRIRTVFGVEMPLRRIFEARTLAELARVVRESHGGVQAPPIAPAPRHAGDSDLPLSFAQQRLWFLDQLEPGNPAYNIPLGVRLTGELSPGLLERVFAEVVRRHEALRTTFVSRGGWPVQVIAVPGVTGLETLRKPELPVVDLSQLPERAFELAREEAWRPFDLQRGPLLRLVLIRLAERDHILLVTMHHIVSDGWSLGVLLREVAALCSLRDLPDLGLQYADFAVWQRQWLQGEVLEAQLAYWKRQLEGAPRVLELPLDRPRPAVQTTRGAARHVSLPPRLSEALHGLCRREGATSFMALLAAWALLLGRHAGQEDVLLGIPVAGRNRREIEGLIGFFVNTLVLRTDLSGAPGFAGLVKRVRRVALDGYAHQDVPFERLVEELVPERDMAHSPLFQAMLVLQNAPAGSLSMPGLSLTPLTLDSGVAKFDLTLSLQEGPEGPEGPEGLGGVVSYKNDLFDGSTVERLWRRFEALLETAVASPEVPVSELPLLLPEERHQALLEWNDTAWTCETGVCLHELFDRQARSTPDAVAASFEERQLTYRELERRANRLAHYLIGLGVGPDDRVGVKMERSLELIVALVGVLKAGAAYVPLDPTYPAERLTRVVESSGARVVLTPESLEEIGDQPDTAPAVAVGEDHLAYVLFTSGSTGTPKGVMVPHRGIVNRLLWDQEYFALTAEDRALQKTPLTFDVSVWELFWPLVTGARLVFARPEGHRDPAYLADLIVREGITDLHFVPSMLQAFLENPELPDLPSLRLAMSGGEPLTLDLMRRFQARVPEAGMFNRYGPTEASVSVTIWECELDPARSAPLGRPISNLRLYVMDRELRLQPLGVPGELLLGGAGLARGYLGRPDLTAAAFVPDPQGDGERLYRTGDLARTLADGNVEFLGRIDHQVKVRGFRIELGEIEAVLASHPEVREQAVIVREDVLVAYVVGTAQAADLKAFLGRRLPEYMVPAVFVSLDAMPLTTSGKVDRKALSASAAPEWEAVPDEEALTDPITELLAGVWSEVLGLDRVGVDQDFFALGGHSLLATQVVSRVRAVLGVELPLRQLFESPTVSGLARAVRGGRESQTPPIVPVPRGGDLPLSFAQQRLWLLDQLEPGGTRYNIPSVLRLTGRLDLPAFAAALDEVVRRHEVLRTTFVLVGDAPVQVVAPAQRMALPVVDLSGLPEAEAIRLALDEPLRPFDLTAGPLLRVILLRLRAEEHVMLADMHHVVSDGWSVGILVRELGALYRAFLEGRPSPLQDLPIQYVDFAVWQRRWLEGDVLERQLAWWRERLAGAPAVLELPADRPRPAVRSPRGGSVPVRLPAGLGRALAALGHREGTTRFMTLLALFQALLGRHADSEDLVVGTPIAGRTRSEVEPLIGFFVNTLALRADLSGRPGLRELLRRVRGTTLGAYAHQDLPFERLVEEVAAERRLGHTPLFQAVFALQNVPGAGGMDLPGLEVRGVPLPSRTAKFDLVLALAEAGDEIRGSIEYSADLFDAPTVSRLGERFRTLLEEAAAADPELPVGELPLLPAPERQQVLVEWSDTAKPCPQSPMVHELVSEHARRRPQATAMADAAGRRLTYGDLEPRSNRLAHHLRALGVGPEVRVAVCMERTLERAVAILGAVKAGGVYVTLDPAYPRERLAFLLEDAGAAVLLTETRFAPLLPETDARVIRIDTDWEEIEGDEAVPPKSGLVPENLAYVVYTSGSTGRPKGVEIPHAGLMNLVRWHQDLYGVSPEDRGTQIASPAFDASVWELWPYLCGGASLHIPDEETRLSPSGMIHWWAEQGITLAYLMTPLAEGVLEEKIPAGLLLRVRALIIGG
ncbi:MAG TPA: amino acid adenylation domain-containing protein, partial [Thermoanaerobaculia bacterium]|nr:amino acid adenylation domain-containing protein [Thermoanaerobaculia bacterium]